eukprot:10793081-Alexandrium_andersonii.AAC.1
MRVRRSALLVHVYYDLQARGSACCRAARVRVRHRAPDACLYYDFEAPGATRHGVDCVRIRLLVPASHPSAT